MFLICANWQRQREVKLWVACCSFTTVYQCIGKKWFENVIPNDTLSAFRYDNSDIATVLTFFLSSVWLLTGAYLSDVWSQFLINDGEIWYLSTISIILGWKTKPTSLMAPLGNFGLPVVAARHTNPILWKRLLAQSVFSKSIHLSCSSLLYSIKAFAVAIATTLLLIPLFVTYASTPSPCYQFHYQEVEVNRLFSSTTPHSWTTLEDISILTCTWHGML